MEPVVSLDHVSKRFGDFVAVDNVSLSIFKGEIFCLLGGSGCGKTTLLRMLAGFEAPTSGRVFIDGQDMADTLPYERPVNMMFQPYAPFPHMTVAKNVSYGLEQEKLSRKEIDQRVTEMLETVKLGELARRKPHQLSGGQRQRVALARALVKKPKLLLLDEPLGALDKKLREATQFELINLQEKLGVTFVVVTHDQEEAMTLATRIGVMDRGEIVQVGTPTEIYEYPTSKLFEGRLTEDEPNYVRIHAPELSCAIYVDHGISSAPGAAVWAAIRPEKIELTREEPTGPDNRAKGVVKDIAYMGDMSIYLVRIDSGKMVRVTLPNSVRQLSERISWDETVWLSWDASSPVILPQ